MTSTASQKRMVSSVFITLAPPTRATVTPTPQITQHSAVPVSPTGTQRKPSTPTSACQDLGRSLLPTEARKPHTDESKHGAAHTAPSRAGRTGHLQKTEKKSPDDSDVSHVPFAPPPSDLKCRPPASTREKQLSDPGRVETTTPPAGWSQNESTGLQVEEDVSPDVCGFCRKPVPLSEQAIEALNRIYHSGCFQCRQCNVPLAGRTYYNKAGLPLCEDCYQASLEPCWACGELIKDQVIRALERAYHPPCFVCTTCKQPIGEQRFAQGEVGEVYCLQDYYRKYAPQCSVCGELIIPREDGTDSYTVECLGQSFHEDCYRCEVCAVLLSPEPNEHGCHPLDGQILCKPCHLTMIQTSQH
ncbi:filamin-binding LIM protein 1 isoform X2 [Trichomycterus rosablanca]|uniref:filamin-binding LIM protein 1 isoform X2 n=1 Tax=Trichomycterus rosablanca TaxID=2290929 RepID=UPI002F351D53